MIYYLNMGFILEQALVDVIKRYIDRQHFDSLYENYHISVVNDHPFAHMIVDEHARANDTFPCIVITSQSDGKPTDLSNMNVQGYSVSLTSQEISDFIDSLYRTKTKINDEGEVVVVKKSGEPVKEKIPGYMIVTDDARIQKLKEIADSRTVGEQAGAVYGVKLETRMSDHVSIEIWTENNQLKNEIYEHLRLLLSTSLETVLREQYEMFDCSIFNKTVHGERGSNYNFDFDTVLYGSHLTFDVDYSVSQVIIDTELNDINNDILVEVINHVKE